MNESSHPPRALPAAMPVAIIGMGGFAAVHHKSVLELENRGLSRLVATCDPYPEKFAGAMKEWRFAERGVKVYNDYRAMIQAVKGEAKVLVVPTPIPLHAEMHRAGVEAGMAVYLEKPPTLDLQELVAMMEVDKKAQTPTLVGFNFIAEERRQHLKGRILAGEFGKVVRGDLMAHWPRAQSYYKRADWAGRLMMGERLVLDSPLGNAMAHQVHNLFFWLGGDGLFSWAPVESLAAVLGRAHDIQGADTFFVEGKTTSAIPFRISMSHGCDGGQRQWERITCEGATLTWTLNKQFRIDFEDGRVEEEALGHLDLVAENHLHFYDTMRGKHRRPLTTLADAAPFVMVNNLVYVSAGEIKNFAPGEVLKSSAVKGETTEHFSSWKKLEEASEAFFKDGAVGGPWEKMGARVTAKDLSDLGAVVKKMCAG